MKTEKLTTYVLLKIEHDRPIDKLETFVDQRSWSIPGVVKTEGQIVDGVDRIKQLHTICGYVEDGSDQTMRLFQDEATRDWIIKAGTSTSYGTGHQYCGSSIQEVLNKAAAGF